MAKGVPIKRKVVSITDNLFIGSHKTNRERPSGPSGPVGHGAIATGPSGPQGPSNSSDTVPDLRDYELMKLRILQEELERRVKKYEKTIDFYQYSLILIIVLLMIKMIVDSSKKS